MKNKMVAVLKRGFVFYCIMYTVITIFSSSLQLFQGRLEDTNSHILNRAVVSFIAIFVMELCANIKFKSKFLTWLVVYTIAMTIVFVYVWITGFFEPLSKHAYRDIFLNFTSVAVVIGVILTVNEKRKEKRGRLGHENKSIS